MEYKGYVADFEYDDIAEVFSGWVANTQPYPIATFWAAEERLLESEFRLSVDVYLESCAEDGVEPLPPLPLAEAREPQPAVAAGDGD